MDCSYLIGSKLPSWLAKILPEGTVLELGEL